MTSSLAARSSADASGCCTSEPVERGGVLAHHLALGLRTQRRDPPADRLDRVRVEAPADLGYEPIAESVAPVVRSRGSRRSRSCYADERHFVMRALR
jgi:hypothetical protein